MSVYATEGNAGGSAYAQTPKSSGSVYAGGSAPAAPKKKGGGGLLSKIPGEDLLAKTASDLYHAAVNTPAGLYYLGKGLATDPVGTVEAVGKSTVEDFKHPLRHPGNTLLDVLGVVGGGAGVAGRVGAAAKALEAGGDAADAAKALAVRPTFGTRTLRSGNLEMHPETSGSALGAGLQHASDKLLQRAADKNPAGRAAGLVNRKIGKTVTAEAKVQSDLAKAPAAALAALGRRLKPEEQKALQIVAEEAPLHGRITATAARVTGARDQAARGRHQAELDLLHKAKPLIDDTGTKPVFTGKPAPKLNAVLDRMRAVSGSREDLLKNLGLLADESVQSRKNAAARVALGEPIAHEPGPEPPTPGQLSLIHEPEKPALFDASPDAVRIPDVATRRGTKTLGKQAPVGAQGTIGHPRAPGSVTHEYTGALREAGLRREDTTRLVAESGMEAAKFAGLKHVVDLAKQAATPTPTRPNDIAIRLDNLKPSERMPLEVRKFLDDPEAFFAHAHPDEKNSALEQLRQHLIVANPRELTGDAAAEFMRLHDQGKIGFVPKAVLGDFAKSQAPLKAVVGSKPVRAVDAINNASRFAILYLKPAYALPNLLGNGALNLLQQGFAAPANVARAVALHWRIGPELTARVDTLMGEGFAQAISSHGAGAIHGAVDKAASIWSKGVDTPFRRASFLYEARRAGFKTPDQIQKLLTDPEHEQQLARITVKANREIIDYSNLSPAEREVVRRVIMFYPWIKGSTAYAGRLLREHPVKAAALGEIGKEGHQKASAEFGPTPSYLEGAFKVGKDELINPASAAILQTPAQIGGAVGGLLSGNISDATSLTGMATPALNLALNEITRKNLANGRGYPGGTDALQVARDTLGNSLPQATLYRNIHEARSGGGKQRLYPPSVRSALEQYIIGSVVPRKYNPAVMRKLAESEQTRIRTGR